MPVLNPEEWTAVALSLKVACWATVLSLPIGIAVAYVLARKSFWGKSDPAAATCRSSPSPSPSAGGDASCGRIVEGSERAGVLLSNGSATAALINCGSVGTGALAGALVLAETFLGSGLLAVAGVVADVFVAAWLVLTEGGARLVCASAGIARVSAAAAHSPTLNRRRSFRQRSCNLTLAPRTTDSGSRMGFLFG